MNNEIMINNLLKYASYNKYLPTLEQFKIILFLIQNTNCDNEEKIVWKNFLLKFNRLCKNHDIQDIKIISTGLKILLDINQKDDIYYGKMLTFNEWIHKNENLFI